MKTITYEGVQHGDWVRCVLCGAQMLLPCGADKCPECGENDTLRWVDEERQEMDAKDLDCLGYVRELRIDDYLSPTTLEEIAHVLNELNIIVRSKSEKCTCENRVPSEEDKKESTDGLYIIYKDGHAEPFTGDNSKDCVRYIGLKHRYMSFAISLTEHDIVQLLDDDSREESGSGTYYEREYDALFDIDGRGNTERLVTRNPKLRNLLENGEYIPSLGQLNLMAHYMDELNKAFAYVSASPLSSTWYWSSTESSQAVAWYVVFSSGLTGTGNKHIGDMVRAIIDF